MNLRNSFLPALLAVSGVFALAPTASATVVTGGTTTVNFVPATISALVGLGFGITPVAPATLNLAGPNAVFPITGGNTNSAITHSGGLTFTKSGTNASISNFTINLLSSRLTGDLTAGGSTTPNVTFFDVGAGNVLTIDAALGAGLSSVFGIPNLTGTQIGTAVVAATLAPEPASGFTAGLAASTALTYALKRRRA
jgi:hypothetical protein